MGELGRRLDKLEERYPASRCGTCAGRGLIILRESTDLSDPERGVCPECKGPPFVIEVVDPTGPDADLWYRGESPEQ